MPANLDEKIKLVDSLAEKFSGAKSIVVVDYRGLTVLELTDLRSQTRNNDVEYKVFKNTMVRRALDKIGMSDLNVYFTGPTAVAISTVDEVTPAKILNDFSADHKNLEIKAGYVDGNVLDVDGVKSLAALPSKETLIAKTLGGLNAPISGLASTLNGVIQKLVIALNAITEQKQEA